MTEKQKLNNFFKKNKLILSFTDLIYIIGRKLNALNLKVLRNSLKNDKKIFFQYIFTLTKNKTNY